MKLLTRRVLASVLICAIIPFVSAQDKKAPSKKKLKEWMKKYPEADTNNDGVLSLEEAKVYRDALKKKKDQKPIGGNLKPSFANCSYGPHGRNVLDFWQAKSDKPTPVLVYIHGGSFVKGSKGSAKQAEIKACLENGVSFAAINYRFRSHAPIHEILRDAARAIQFIRSRAAQWNVAKERIGAYGSSAGAGTSLWLAFHDDLASPQSKDSVLRESSRIVVAGASSGQFSYDIPKWAELFGKAGANAFSDDEIFGFYHIKSKSELKSSKIRKIRADVDMHGLITKDDPPVYLCSKMEGGEPKGEGHIKHHPKHASSIKKRCDEVGVEAHAEIPAFNIKPKVKGPMLRFLITKLKKQ